MIDFTVSVISRKEVQQIIEKWHYSHSINGIISDYCFGLFDKNKLIGGMIFGRMAMRNQWKKYVDDPKVIIELRRLACIDDTPKNTESYFIGKCLKWLRKNTQIKTIMSYADSNYNHTGIVYRASNFKFIGMTAKGRVIIYNGKKYHDKAIRTKYKGVLKPFAKKLKEALEDGSAHYRLQASKYIYRYDLYDKLRSVGFRNNDVRERTER